MIRRVRFRCDGVAYAWSNICCFSGSGEWKLFAFLEDCIYEFDVVKQEKGKYTFYLLNGMKDSTHPDRIYDVLSKDFHFVGDFDEDSIP